MRPIHDDAVWPLAIAICKRAALDYDSCLRNGDKSKINRKECELFFTGPLFAAMCGVIPPEEIMTMVRRGELHQRKPYTRKKRKRNYVRKCYLDT